MGERLKGEPTPSVDDEGRIQKYLAGRLGAAEAEAFEERLIADDQLAAEVQRALEIRAAAAQADATRRIARSPRRVWLPLAAAAGAAAFAVGVIWLQRPPPEAVFRGIEQRMELEVQADAGALRARWPAVAGAAGYEIQLFAGDGRVLRNLETSGTSATIELGTPDDPASAAAFIDVTALDDLGQILQRSERVAL